MPSAAQNKATQKYIATHMRRWVLQINKFKEPEIVAWLESQENVTGYIKELVRADMQKNQK